MQCIRLKGEGEPCLSELTIVNDEWDMRNLWALDLDVVDNEGLARKRTHKTARSATELVQGCKLSGCVHITVLSPLNSVSRTGHTEEKNAPSG